MEAARHPIKFARNDILRHIFVEPQACEDDPVFKRILTRTNRSGLRVAGFLGILGPAIYVCAHYFILDKKLSLTYTGYNPGTLVPLDLLVITAIGVVAMIASYREWGARAGRFLLGAMLVALTVAMVSDDVLRGELSMTVGYLALLYFIGATAIPFRPWQIVLIGVLMLLALIVTVVSLPGFAGIPPMKLRPDVFVYLAILIVFATGVSSLLYYSRYNLYLVQVREREIRQRALKHARDLRTVNRELRETQARLVQSEKMASLGKLVAGTAHEVNSPLGAAMSSAQTVSRALDRIESALVTQRQSDGSVDPYIIRSLTSAKDSMTVIQTSHNRLSSIVNSLKAFARLDQSEWKMTQVNDCVRDTLAAMKGSIPPSVTVESSLAELPMTFCSPVAINQVLYNIAQNCLEAIEPNGTIKIATIACPHTVLIQIEDNGRGIPPELIESVCDPGVTTKGPGVGVGLGLATCYRIVFEHKGELHIESSDSGTIVSVSLPIVTKEPHPTGLA